jgi:hypothetical protein
MRKRDTPWEVFLRQAYPTIRSACLVAANRDGQRYVIYSTSILATMTTCDAHPKGLNFRCDGDGYNALVEHREELWDDPLSTFWMGDGVTDGIAFTACPMIGVRWYITYHVVRLQSIMLKAADASRVGAVLRPSETPFFGILEKGCRALAGSSMRLLESFSGPEVRAKEMQRLEEWSGKRKSPKNKR